MYSAEVFDPDNQADQSRAKFYGKEYPGHPLASATVEVTEDGLRIIPYERRQEEDALRIDFYPNPRSGGIGEDRQIVRAMMNLQDTRGFPVIAWAQDSTHTTRSFSYYELPQVFEELRYDPTAFNHTHLDGYIWDPRNFPEGPNDNEFSVQFRRTIVEPLGIPEEKFLPIEAFMSFEEAQAYAVKLRQIWQDVKPLIGVFGLGPDLHLAYIPKDMDRDTGVSAIQLSQEIVDRNRKRGEIVPDVAITIGKLEVAMLERRFVAAWGPTYRPRVTELFTPMNQDSVAKMLFEPDVRRGTVFSFDIESGKDLLYMLLQQNSK